MIADDPRPTTGAAFTDIYVHDWPEGCHCSLREDIDWGEHRVAPPHCCPVHTPWAFPGYSLSDEALDQRRALLDAIARVFDVPADLLVSDRGLNHFSDLT